MRPGAVCRLGAHPRDPKHESVPIVPVGGVVSEQGAQIPDPFGLMSAFDGSRAPVWDGSADAYRSTQRRRPNGLLTGACTIFFPSGERMKLIDPSKKISVNNSQVMAPVGRSRKKFVK